MKALVSFQFPDRHLERERLRLVQDCVLSGDVQRHLLDFSHVSCWSRHSFPRRWKSRVLHGIMAKAETVWLLRHYKAEILVPPQEGECAPRESTFSCQKGRNSLVCRLVTAKSAPVV